MMFALLKNLENTGKNSRWPVVCIIIQRVEKRSKELMNSMCLHESLALESGGAS